MLSLLMQPTLEGFLNDALNLPDDSIPLVHLDNVLPNFSTLLASHVVTGVILSPVELIRTRCCCKFVANGPLADFRAIKACRSKCCPQI